MTGAERAAERVYEELLTRVGEANPRPRIEPVRRLAELVGSPQLSYPVIQVAGTNGKTSTSRAIESLVRAHGLRTGLFTSPHLVDFTERFQIDGVPVGGKVLADAWDELRLPLEVLDAQLEAEGMGAITFFEALAVLAFTLFADAPVDVAVIEVGMGGEWDATNIADAQVAVFTPIDLDHTAVLGTDIETIARTKAGIVKQGSTVVTAAQDSAALVELVEAAEREDARIFVSARDFDVTEDLLAVGGRQITIRGLTSVCRLCARLMKCRIMASVTSKSAMTPSFIGRMASMLPGTLPSMALASAPTAWMVFLPCGPPSWRMATTEGSSSTMPLART